MPARRPHAVAYVDNSSTFGGAILSLAHLCAAFDRGRVEATVISAQPRDELDRLFPGTTSRHMPMWTAWSDAETGARERWRRVPGGGPARTAWSVVRHRLPLILDLRSALGRVSPDLVHLNNVIEGQPEAALAGRSLGVPVIAHARGFQTPRGTARVYARWPRLHVAISSAIAENLESLGVGPERIRVVPDGIDLEPYAGLPPAASVRSTLGIPSDAVLVGFFGRIVRWKGVLEFVEAFARAAEGRPAAHAMVVGSESDGGREYADAVRRRVGELGLTQRVHFTGYRTDVPALMAAADVVAHTSIEPEPFGLVMVEAMAAGRPVVAADRGGPVDIVEPDVTGLLADPSEPEAFSAALAKLLDDPGLREGMGSAGRDRAQARYSKEAYARAIEALYDEVLEPDAASARR